MFGFWRYLALGCALAVTCQSAHACIMAVERNPADVGFADKVVIGKVTNYRIVRDLEFRKRMLANKNLSFKERQYYADPKKSLGPDYARFDVHVMQTLVGKPARRITVTWDNSTFDEPASIGTGPFLIALRDPASPMPPLRGPSATVFPNREPGTLTLLQAPCASPFLLPVSDPEVKIIRQHIAEKSKTKKSK